MYIVCGWAFRGIRCATCIFQYKGLIKWQIGLGKKEDMHFLLKNIKKTYEHVISEYISLGRLTYICYLHVLSDCLTNQAKSYHLIVL